MSYKTHIHNVPSQTAPRNQLQHLPVYPQNHQHQTYRKYLLMMDEYENQDVFSCNLDSFKNSPL
jgi:hypothetical protein